MKRISLTMLLITVTASMVGCSTAAHYRRTRSATALREILATRICPGDSYDKVVGILGPGRPFSLDLYRKLASFHSEHPDVLPDGFEDSDIILIYVTDTFADFSLHFREGRLINHPLAIESSEQDESTVPSEVAPGASSDVR